VKKLLSLIIAVAMTLALFTGVTASALTVTNQIYVNGVEDALASGDIEVCVTHGAVTAGSTVVGAIYEDGRLFAVKSADAGATCTDLPFGELTLDASKTYTFKSIILNASTLALAETAEAQTASTIYVQGEEFATLTTRAGAVYTGTQVASGWLASGAEIDYAVYSSNGTPFPSVNSGTGLPLNEWSTVYAVNWRGDVGQEMATYTVNVPVAGTYKMTLSAISWGNRDMNVTVGASTINVPTIYKTSDEWTPMEIGEFDFVAGENTITFAVGTLGSYDIQVDYIELEPVGAIAPVDPTTPPTDTPVTDATTFYVQAEEFDTLTTTSGTVFTGAQVASGWLAAGAAIGDAAYVPNDAAFPSENSGTGIPLNEWSKVYGVTWRGNVGQEMATYTANAPAAGAYKMSLASISWGNREMDVTVGSTTITVPTTYKTSDDWTMMEIGEFELVEGANSVTFAVGTLGSYDIQVDYIVFEPVGAAAPTETPVDPTEAPTEIPVDPTEAPTQDPSVPTEVPTERPIPTPDANNVITVQAEEFVEYYNGGATHTSMVLADGFSVNWAIYGDNAGTGNGVDINEYSKAYGVMWSFQGIGSPMAMYQVEVPEAGIYSLDLSSKNGNTRDMLITVNDTVYNGVVTFTTGADGNISLIDYETTKLGNVALEAGVNTITFAINNGSSGTIYADCFTLTGRADEDAIRVEAEEFDEVSVTKAGSTTTYTSIWGGLVTDAGHVLNEGGLAIADPNNGTGTGVQFNQHAKSYCMIFRSGVSYKYTVMAPVTGTYTLKLRTDCCNENAVYPIVYVNEGMTDIYAPLDIAPDYSTYLETELGTVDLNEGTNTITFEIAGLDFLPETEASDGYFDWFEVQLVPAA